MAKSKASQVFVLDNGAYCAKAGFSNRSPKIMPNCIMKAKHERRRLFIGDQIQDCRDASGLYYIYPHQKGYLINWDIQKTVWDYMFGKDSFNINFSDTCVLVTEPYFDFPSIQEGLTEIFLEEYEFHSLIRKNVGDLSVYRYQQETPGESCCLVVDSGYSFTHITPFYNKSKVKESIRRIDVSGKILTNHLKEIVSYRQLNMMDETFVVNQMKEDACFVSMDFNEDMRIAKLRGAPNTICRDYVLPDFTSISRGFMKTSDESQGEQVVRMNNERFSVPELLFHPSDIGINQMGIAETIVECIASCPEYMRHQLYRNILLTGGCCCFPGFKDRVYQDVRSMAPVEYKVQVFLPDDPITYAWQGGCMMANGQHNQVLTRKQYDEMGFHGTADKFDI